MSSGNAPVLEFDVKENRDDVPSVGMIINRQRYDISLPKLGIATSMVTLFETYESEPLKFAAQSLSLFRTMIGYIHEVPGREPAEDEDGEPNPNAGKLRGQARILQRINDPHDSFDISDMRAPFEAIMELMFNRPTSLPDESSSNPASTGPSSRAGTRSTRAKTSGKPRRASSSPSVKASASTAGSTSGRTATNKRTLSTSTG